MDQNNENSTLDKVGIVGSGACVAHCLLIPVLAFASPSISSFLENEWIHKGLLIALIPISLIAFLRSQKIHKKNRPVILGAVGVASLILAVLLERLHIEIPYSEQALTTLGSILLISAHYINIKFTKQVTCGQA
jgi:hypothetical protein